MDAGEADFVAAVEALGLAGSPVTDAGIGSDMLLDVNGRTVAVELKAAATVSPHLAERLVAAAVTTAPVDGACVVVADRVVDKARDVLRAAGWGWLDRRGHLRIDAPGILVDSSFPALTEPRGLPRAPLRRRVAQEVAVALLLAPDRARGVRDLAGELGRAPSSVSEAMRALRAQALIDDDGLPAASALFWELAEHWPTTAQALQRQPAPGEASLTEQLQLGLNDIEHTVGWALTDTLAAAAFGAPLGVGSAHPPDFYVPTREVARQARLVLGAAPYAERGCTVRPAPVAFACSRRVDGTRLGVDAYWPLAQPLFVALDLAADPGRGHEALASWDPPEPWARVW
jgi:hypothetical protein